jgi:hypothetical protein
MEELSRVAWSPPGRFLLRRADELLLASGSAAPWKQWHGWRRNTALAARAVREYALGEDTVATVTSGRRRVRLILASVPFGYRSPEHEETDLAAFRELLAG